MRTSKAHVIACIHSVFIVVVVIVTFTTLDSSQLLQCLSANAHCSFKNCMDCFPTELFSIHNGIFSVDYSCILALVVHQFHWIHTANESVHSKAKNYLFSQHIFTKISGPFCGSPLIRAITACNCHTILGK
jgi:hypothetical protein